MKDQGRASLNLRSSVCTDTPTGSDLYPFSTPMGSASKPFGEGDTQVIQNTGIERNGGISALYEQETTFATAGAQSLITKSGDLLQVDSSHNIRINNSVIGNVGPYAVSSRGALKGYSDAAWSASNTIIGIVKIGSAIKVDEYNPATGTVINTRSTTFSMPAIAITNIVLVKYIGMNYADSLTFILSNSIVSYSLVEANAPFVVIVGKSIGWSEQAIVDGFNSIAWSPQLAIFAAVGPSNHSVCYAGTSPDGINWTSRTLAAGTWLSIAWSPQLSLFVAVGTGAAASSPDGITWTSRTAPSTDSWQSVVWSPQLSLFVAVSRGLGTGSYAATSPDGINWTPRTLEANAWYSITWSSSLSLFVAVGYGGTHYAATSPDGINWTVRTLAVGNWTSVAWSPQLSLFVAVGVSTNYSASSPDGINWTVRSLAAYTWLSVVWSPQLSLFVAVGTGAANYSASSSDGINWTTGYMEGAASWQSVSWSPLLLLFCAVDANVASHKSSVGILLCKNINFCWKFAANKFIVGNQGISNFLIGDIAGAMTVITDGTWCAIDIFQGTAYSRAILSFAVKKNASNLLTGIGEVGYNQSGTYSATPTYYGVALGATTVSITNNISGPGYAEATFTRSDSGTNIYYYQAPIMQHNPGQWYDNQQSQTQTLCNGYGRLSDFQGNALGNTCSLRIIMELGIPTTISAGVISQDGAYDTLGVPITNIGEFDEFFMPHVVDNGSTQLACIYRNNGVLFFFVISSGSVNTLQAVSDNVYMVNTLSPINAIDVQNRTLNLGSNDYNGRILFRSSAALIAMQQVDCLVQTPYINSSDTGAKFITQTFSTSNVIPGIELPSFIDRAVANYGVNVYVGTAPAPPYAGTYQSFNVSYINSTYVGVLYVPDTRIPFGMGYTFYNRAMQTEIETVLTGVGVAGSANINYDYLGYEIGNDTPGQFQEFILFSQEYIFDGNNIWLASFNGSLFAGKGNAPVCTSTGMSLIAVAPTEVYFLSSFDNSIYTFNGGRSLTKMKRMNQEDAISGGAFNVRDNTLCLNGTNHFIWVRDSVITVNAKKSNQTSLTVYDTVNGIQIANNTLKWIYSFSALAGSTVVPLTWQSGYHSLRANELSITMNWIITFYSPDGKVQAPVTMTCYGFDQENYSTQKGSITIQPSWWDGLGFCRLRIQPKTEKALASSVQVDTTAHLVITDVTVLYGDEAQAPIASVRSI